MPVAEVAAIWTFPGVRREGREYGVAVIARRAAEDPDGGEGGRLRVYRARTVLQVKGQERGSVLVEIEETAEAPPEAVPRVLDGVRRRADEAGEAAPLDLGPWKGALGGDPDA
jgi:hypothetical protein